MQVLTSSLREQFEADWRSEEEALRAVYDAEISAAQKQLQQEREKLSSAQREAATAQTEVATLKRKMANMEKQMQMLHENQLQSEANSKRTLSKKEELNLRCLSYEREISKLRQELEGAILRSRA